MTAHRQPLPQRAPGRAREALLVLLGLWGVAVAQPLFDLLGRNTAFFVAHRADFGDLVLFALLVSAVGPALLALLVYFVRRIGGVLGSPLVVGLWAALAALLAAQRLHDLLLPGAVAALLAVVIGGLGALLLYGSAPARRFAGWLGLAGFVFPLLFLFASPARKIGVVGPAGGGRPRPAAEPLRPISAVLIVLDELPLVSLMNEDEMIDAGRFPNFAALADTATWYRNATTVSQATAYAVPAILRGRYPPPRKVLQPVWADYKKNLFTLLGRRVNLNVIETLSRLCPQKLCSGRARILPRRTRVLGMARDSAAVYLHLIAPRGWREHLPVIGESWRNFWHDDEPVAKRNHHGYDQDVALAFDEFLESIRAFPPPALHYVHLMAPHLPWNRLPDGTVYRTRQRAPHGLVNQRWRGTQWEVTQAQQRHLLQVGWVDTLLGRLRQRLQSLGLWRDTLLVITSDHGTAFGPPGLRRSLTAQNFVEIVNVPLFIKYPGQVRGEIDDSNVETIDVLPTVLEAFGVSTPKSVRGVDLAKAARRGTTKTVYHSGRHGSSAGWAEEYETTRLRERGSVVARTAVRLGTGDWKSLFEIGRFRELLGRPASELRGAERPPARPFVELDRADEYATVDPSATYQPVHLTGRLIVPPEESPTSLAVAINGVVRGVTETFIDGEKVRFTSLLPR
ncbi:MAG: sulfatase-like hydrolase/transferase, partial [Acidobacteria bacterium]|nr:sulfatase-like hydrolase/transferase [Acidobacteriota bacterium]